MSSHEPELHDMLQRAERETDVIELDQYVDYVDIDRLASEIFLFFALTLGGEAYHQRGLRRQRPRGVASAL
eukprot:4827717-Heterocapsa_arctica.AAC.1